MGRIDYKKIYAKNQDDWKALTRDPEKYENLLAGHYSESNHFVYELLQNAEDENATTVVFEYYKDKLVFYHNGDPFDEADVIGVSSMLMGTKDRNDAQKIGRFGMGFKSVFKYTYQPEIYSDDEAFKITNYLLPVEIKEKWDFRKEKSLIEYPDGSSSFRPFIKDPHLTKIIIPFVKRKEGELIPVNGKDVLYKLDGLSGEILLFLNHIRDLYWINKSNGKHAHITLGHSSSDDKVLTCRITGSDLGTKEDISRYLRYKKVFSHPDMKNAEVSIAYRLNAQAKNINELDESPVWVYFPTRDMTDLPFLVHGSFETAVSREKLMTPSRFNDDLFDQLGNLIAESMTDLAERKLITQAFLRRILLTAFRDEEENHTIKGLKAKLTRVFSEECLLPDRNGEYHKKDQLVIAVPFQLADLRDNSLLAKSFESVGQFVALNNENERFFTEYYSWLRDDLEIRQYDLFDWSASLFRMPVQRVDINGKTTEELKKLYDFLSEFQEKYHCVSYYYTRISLYEQAVRKNLAKAWEQLRRAPVILNGENDLVPAYEGDTLFIYLNPSSHYQKLAKHSVVSSLVAKQYETLFKDSFKIADFDNFQYVKENVVKKYIRKDVDHLEYEVEEFSETTYLEDIRLLLGLLEESGNEQEIQELIKNACIIKIKTNDSKAALAYPHKVYVDTSDEGIDLKIYYAPIRKPNNPDLDNFHHFPIDKEFYENHEIALSKLKKFGLITTPVSEGARSNPNGTGDSFWRATGDFCPNLKIEGFVANKEFINNFPEETIARQKSAEMLKLLLLISNKLRGTIKRRKINPWEDYGASHFTTYINNSDWLFTRSGELSHPTRMSRFDLNESIYRDLPNMKEAFEVIGFKKKEEDTKAETFERIEALDRRDKNTLLRQLARELGFEISPTGRTSGNEGENEDEMFSPESVQSTEFPQRRVRDFELLRDHVRREFYFADRTKYETVLRQIRTSKSPKANRAYSHGMYENEGGAYICQMCKSGLPVANNHILSEITEIANFGIEMPQMNLCLCKNCAARYKQFRDGNKEQFRNEMKKAIREIDVSIPDDEYKIILSPDASVCFTQTHLAEVKEILSLLDQYGVPNKETSDLDEGKKDSNNMGPLAHPSKNHDHSSANKQDGNTLQMGTKVYHKQFGEGIVTFVNGDTVGILFKDLSKTGGTGEKRLSLKSMKKGNLLSIL